MRLDHISWEEAVIRLRAHPDQKELVSHCYYDDPVEEAAERYSRSEEWSEILHLLENRIPASVLDIGAGRGISSYAFAKAGCEVTALEPDSGPIVGTQAIRELFSKAQLPVSIVEGRAENLFFPDDSFDIVYGRSVMHHSENLIKLCRETARVLKKGGIFLMTREHVISRREDLRLFLDAHPLHALYGGENAYLLEDYVSPIRDAGLRMLRVIGPFESVVNYAPRTISEFKRMLVERCAAYSGNWIAQQMMKSVPFKTWYARRLSEKYDEPGRLYTFMAAK